jgi:hypothetical protein
MDVSSATIFLVASILISLGAIILVAAIVFVNNILHKYWKPIKVYAYHALPEQEIEVEEPKKK